MMDALKLNESFEIPDSKQSFQLKLLYCFSPNNSHSRQVTFQRLDLFNLQKYAVCL
jgi:hypothetical protein